MKKDEFVKWLDEVSCYSKTYEDKSRYDNDDWEYWEYLEIKEDKVIFNWERLYWGGSNLERNEYEFDRFVEKYNNSELKD